MARVEPGFRVFFVFPFTHSEDAADQALSMALSARIDPGRAERVSGHRDIIRRFGRFPHRNPLLGRGHTADEADYLGEGGFRSEEHTSELQSLMRSSYAVFCLKKKRTQITQ